MAATVAHCVFPGLDQEEHSAQPCSAAAEERRVRDIHGQHQPRGPALQHRLRARPRRSLSQLPPWTRRSRWTRRLPGGGGAGAWTRGSWRRRRRSTHVPPLARRFGETGQEGWQPDRVGGIYRLEGRADGLVAVVFTHLSFPARGERIRDHYALLTQRVLYEMFQRTEERLLFCFCLVPAASRSSTYASRWWLGRGSQRRHGDPWPQSLHPLQGAT
jgi:hypothetical protein